MLCHGHQEKCKKAMGIIQAWLLWHSAAHTIGNVHDLRHPGQRHFLTWRQEDGVGQEGSVARDQDASSGHDAEVGLERCSRSGGVRPDSKPESAPYVVHGGHQLIPVHYLYSRQACVIASRSCHDMGTHIYLPGH